MNLFRADTKFPNTAYKKKKKKGDQTNAHQGENKSAES